MASWCCQVCGTTNPYVYDTTATQGLVALTWDSACSMNCCVCFASKRHQTYDDKKQMQSNKEQKNKEKLNKHEKKYVEEDLVYIEWSDEEELEKDSAVSDEDDSEKRQREESGTDESDEDEHPKVVCKFLIETKLGNAEVCLREVRYASVYIGCFYFYCIPFPLIEE